METNIQKWGNSLGVRLPREIMQNHNFKEGSRVVVTATKTGIAIEVAKKQPKRLADMLKNINTNNLHSEMSWGSARGNEVW